MWLYIAIAAVIAVLAAVNLPWASIGGLFKGGESKPTRDAAVKAYDVLKAYLPDGDADLKNIWGKLS